MQIIAIDIRLIGKKRTGDETVFFNLTRALTQMDTENEYLLLTDKREAEAISLLEERLGCRGRENVKIISLLGQNRFFWNLFTIPYFLLTHTVDIYHTQYIAPLFVPRRTKLVTHIHDVSFCAHPEWIGTKDLFFLKLLIPRSLRRSTAILVPSRFTQEEVLTYFSLPKEKVKIIPNACDPAWFEPVREEEKEKIRTRFQLTSPYLVTVGTMQPRKNIAFLIQVFRKLRLRKPDLSLVLVGNSQGPHVDPLVRALAEKGEEGILFPGYLSERELQALVAGAMGSIFPSLYEGFGIPLLEAFAVGTPVAASDIPPFHEVGGEAVLFFNPQSLAEAEKALYTLSINTDEREILIAQGKERKKLFSWEKSVRILVSVYENL